jgi:Uma2 family endonuclease
MVDPSDPRAPPQSVWDALDESEQRRIVDSLPSDVERAGPPEGDQHRVPKNRALEALGEYFRRIRRRIYLSAELPVYYPDEPMFAPDVLAVMDAEPHPRASWVVSQEKRGLDFVLEIHVSGSAKKDVELNVERYARLGIPEYFAFDPVRRRLLGWRLPDVAARAYAAVVSQEGRWPSAILDLDLAIEGSQLRFFYGSAPLLDAAELIVSLSKMVDEGTRRAEEEARRAERLAERLRALGIDPDQE